MKKKTFKILAVLFFAAAICVTGITLSQNNEYKKFLELNKKALATEKEYLFGNGQYGKCSAISGKCEYICPKCGFESGRLSTMGDPYDIGGFCFCGYKPTN